MASPEDPMPVGDHDGLGERDRAVLSEMSRAGDARVAFQGLRRRLNVHQQALVRTLRRLERAGLVARDPSGYRLTEQAHALLKDPTPTPSQDLAHLSVAQILLPPRIDGSVVTAQLAGRWFHGLRWYGRTDGPDETVLIWLAEPEGAQVRVRVVADVLRVEVEPMPDAPGREFVVARGLLGALTEFYNAGTLAAATRFHAGLAA